jgi:carbon starvation protein
MILVILGGAAIFLVLGGRFYSRILSRVLGEDPSRPTPAVRINDGRDYVPTRTPVVFAHHFASIAGAGPIIGPLLALCFGWLPAVLWIVFGGLLIGGVHDFCATFIAMREGGKSLAVVTRRTLGRAPFLMFIFLIIALLSLVTAVFLQISAQALTSVATTVELGIAPGQHALARHEFVDDAGQTSVRIGGIASTSVIIMTMLAPLIGWLYIRRHASPAICSVLALLICALSVAVGMRYPVRLAGETWMLCIAGYTLLAAGLPVWLFLQSRDFINVHILYVGIAALVASLIGAGLSGASINFEPATLAEGAVLAGGFLWPVLFITIACGACSGFHSLCAGGTTCKQLTSETAARRVGYWAMLLESFLAVCVVGAVVIGLSHERYLAVCYPAVGQSNVNLGFSLAMGNTLQLGLGLPAVWGTIFGMLLLEGFVVTTLDTAVRLNRYLFEEAWATLFARYDVFAEADDATAAAWEGEVPPEPAAGAGGIPPDSAALVYAAGALAPRQPVRTEGLQRSLLLLLRRPWFNTALAVGLMLWMAHQGGVRTIWALFASGNQLLAGLGLAIASVWLVQRGRTLRYTLIPAIFMLVTTITMLGKLLVQEYLPNARTMTALLVTDVVVLLLTAGLLYHFVRALASAWRTTDERAAMAAHPYGVAAERGGFDSSPTC